MLTLRKKLKTFRVVKTAFLIIIAISFLMADALAKPERSSKGQSKSSSRTKTQAPSARRTNQPSRQNTGTSQPARKSVSRPTPGRTVKMTTGNRPNTSLKISSPRRTSISAGAGRTSATSARQSQPTMASVTRNTSSRPHSVTRNTPSPFKSYRPSAAPQIRTNMTTRTVRQAPQIERNVFVSTNNHTKITPVRPLTKTSSRSTNIVSRTESKTRIITSKPVVKRQVTVKTPTAITSQSRTRETIFRKPQKSSPVAQRTKTRAETIVKTPTKSPTKPIVKRHSAGSSLRITDKITPERTTNRRTQQVTTTARRTDRRIAGVNTNATKNITINNTVISTNTTRLQRPIVRTSTSPAVYYRGDSKRRHGSHDVKVIKHVDFCRQRHGNYPGRIYSRIVWPSYSYRIYYNWSGHSVCRYYRPYYHRKYVFVSFGGYWPGYSYVRYYHYGWHPYKWYGSYPTAYEIVSPTYRYYTYNSNYYSTGSAAASTSYYSSTLPAVDETTFEDVRQKLAAQADKQPAPETLTDKFFDDGVTAFENEDYDAAAKAFANATALEPNDVVLPFAYVQALFATQQYSRAADILRLALAAMPADQQGLFFPRGLYKDDQILLDQVEKLRVRAETFTYDLDMSLLLGYQYLGIEEYDNARQWLQKAAQYDYNKDSSTVLLKLLDMLEQKSI